MRAITFMVVSPSGGVCCLAPPHGDGVSADKRRPLGPTNERGHPLQASETALGTVGLVCPMPPHHMTGRQPPTGRIGGGVHLPHRPHIDHGHPVTRTSLPRHRASPPAIHGARLSHRRSRQKQGRYRGRKPALSEGQLARARRLVAEGVPKTKVAAQLGVGRSTLYRALRS